MEHNADLSFFLNSSTASIFLIIPSFFLHYPFHCLLVFHYSFYHFLYSSPLVAPFFANTFFPSLPSTLSTLYFSLVPPIFCPSFSYLSQYTPVIFYSISFLPSIPSLVFSSTHRGVVLVPSFSLVHPVFYSFISFPVHPSYSLFYFILSQHSLPCPFFSVHPT